MEPKVFFLALSLACYAMGIIFYDDDFVIGSGIAVGLGAAGIAYFLLGGM